ncbi:MAG: endonuclease/exonuclease/phosphatase family protein [Clostridia bacterium]|nr:endonuclease/exonuclease/phosphatase family protein [Clostridia bacterium]
MKIMTYNLRCTWLNADGVNAFLHRAGLMLDTLETEKPDVICFQEVIEVQQAFLEKHLNDYLLLWHGRYENYNGEGLAIAVRKDTMALHGLEVFWLSPTPQKPGSRFEKQSDCPRICQIATLRQKATGKLFRVFNVHLDHISEEARVLGMGAAMEAIEKENQKLALPLFLLGDMNAYPESEAIQNAKYVLVDLTENSGGTYHEFGHKEEKIDYIFTDNQTAKNSWQCTRVERMDHGIYLSDHYPVMVEGEL